MSHIHDNVGETCCNDCKRDGFWQTCCTAHPVALIEEWRTTVPIKQLLHDRRYSLDSPFYLLEMSQKAFSAEMRKRFHVYIAAKQDVDETTPSVLEAMDYIKQLQDNKTTETQAVSVGIGV